MEFLTRYLDAQQLITTAVAYVPRLLAAVVTLFAFWLLYRAVRRPLAATMRHSGLHEKLVTMLVDSIFRYTLIAFGMVMALSQLGVNVGAAIAGLGVMGIAVGLAAQDSLANTIAGFTIFWDQPFIVGDYLSVAGEYGRVQDITLRSTRIRTPRNSYVVIPNKRIIDEVLENDSKHGELRIDVPIGIAYKEDIHAARQALLKAVAHLQDVLDVPEPDVVVADCADSSVNLLVRVWVHDAGSRQSVKCAVMEAAKRGLDAAGIEIPFPHLQLFWDDVEDRVVRKLSPLTGSGPAA